jgi:hypothetical protein
VDRPWRDLIGTFFGVKPPLAEEPQDRRQDRRAASSIKVMLQWIEENGELAMANAILENVSQKGFAVRTDAEIPEGLTIWLTRPDSPALKSIVRHVQKEGGVYVLGLARIVQERRRDDRTPVEGAGMLRRTGPHGETLSMDVQIRNIAPEGVQVAAPNATPKDEVARLVGSAVECTGTVKYCVPWNGKFLIGLFLIGKVHRNAPQDELYGD